MSANLFFPPNVQGVCALMLVRVDFVCVRVGVSVPHQRKSCRSMLLQRGMLPVRARRTGIANQLGAPSARAFALLINVEHATSERRSRGGGRGGRACDSLIHIYYVLCDGCQPKAECSHAQ